MGCEASTKEVVKLVQRAVVSWEKEHWVDYPWRVDRTPYKVLIAELLLKRTTRQAVAREFPKFIKRFPDFQAIYEAPLEEVEAALQPLGLYKQRAQHLKQLVRRVVEEYHGSIPGEWEELIKLPGVGYYLAGAVMSFGYGKRAPVIDSNVIRVVSRLTGTKGNSYTKYLGFLWKLIPEKDHELFNYGLIDLGANVCHYKSTKCHMCPLRDVCVQCLKNIGKNDRARCFEEVFKTLLHSSQKDP